MQLGCLEHSVGSLSVGLTQYMLQSLADDRVKTPMERIAIKVMAAVVAIPDLYLDISSVHMYLFSQDRKKLINSCTTAYYAR